jgi:hypothetical protein
MKGLNEDEEEEEGAFDSTGKGLLEEVGWGGMGGGAVAPPAGNGLKGEEEVG